VSKLTKAGKVWRGIKDATLPKEFWIPNEMGVRGGIEYAGCDQNAGSSQLRPRLSPARLESRPSRYGFSSTSARDARGMTRDIAHATATLAGHIRVRCAFRQLPTASKQ
jgi:hypothetical protein